MSQPPQHVQPLSSNSDRQLANQTACSGLGPAEAAAGVADHTGSSLEIISEAGASIARPTLKGLHAESAREAVHGSAESALHCRLAASAPSSADSTVLVDAQPHVQIYPSDSHLLQPAERTDL